MTTKHISTRIAGWRQARWLTAGVPVLFVLLWACTRKAEIIAVPVPVITSVNKTVLHVGDTLFITGSGFNTVADKNLVAIASATLQVIQASPSQLQAIVPQSAQSGELTVSFAGGQAARYTGTINIIGGTQPFINSVAPSTVYTGDTVVIHGGNFAIPASSNAVVVGGTGCKILNVTDSVIRLVIPEMAHSGKLTVTTNGTTSLPVSFTVLRPDPLADGRIYWTYGLSNPFGTSNSVALRGTDSAFAFPYGTDAFVDNSANEFNNEQGAYAQTGNAASPLEADAQGNFYFFYNLPAPCCSPGLDYALVKLTPGDGGLTRKVLFEQDFTDQGSSLYYPIPGDDIDYTYVPNTPNQVSIDGNTAYMKVGITNNYFKMDLTAAAPVFTPTAPLVADSMSFGFQFGTNYMFYKTLGSDNNYSTNIIDQVRYVRRGSQAAQVIPIPTTEKVMVTLAGSDHGDNMVLLTLSKESIPSYKLYMFNAATQSLKLLYSTANWVDALAANQYVIPVTGITWAGHHIYYADAQRTGESSALYVLNDDGSSTRSQNVYPRLEPSSSTSPAMTIKLFVAKK